MTSKTPDPVLPKADRVYATLKQRIRDLDLAPGTLLKKDELATELGVSRAPISEAIARLTEEGLVDVFPQHGSFVAAIRESDVREAMFIRVGLEVEAWRQAALRRTPELVAQLDANLAAQRATLEAGDMAAFYELDEGLHETIFSFIGRLRVLKFLDGVRAQLDRVRRQTLPGDGRAEATLAEHTRLVESVRLGDPEFAAAAIRSHLAAVEAAIEPAFAPPGQDAG